MTSHHSKETVNSQLCLIDDPKILSFLQIYNGNIVNEEFQEVFASFKLPEVVI